MLVMIESDSCWICGFKKMNSESMNLKIILNGVHLELNCFSLKLV